MISEKKWRRVGGGGRGGVGGAGGVNQAQNRPLLKDKKKRNTKEEIEKKKRGINSRRKLPEDEDIR